MHSQFTSLLFLLVLGFGSVNVLGWPDSGANRHRAIHRHDQRSDKVSGHHAHHQHAKRTTKKQFCSAKTLPSNGTAADTTSIADSSTTTVTTASTQAHHHHSSTSTPAATPTANSHTGTGTEYTGDATFYGIGLGACGKTSYEPDLIAAVSYLLFDEFAVTEAEKGNPNLNPICGRKAKATLEGFGSVIVTILDECMGCQIKGSLDFSMAAFNQLTYNQEGVGRFHNMTWNFV